MSAASLSRLASEYAGFELFAYKQTLARITFESAFELTEQEKLTLTTLLSRPAAPRDAICARTRPIPPPDRK